MATVRTVTGKVLRSGEPYQRARVKITPTDIDGNPVDAYVDDEDASLLTSIVHYTDEDGEFTVNLFDSTDVTPAGTVYWFEIGSASGFAVSAVQDGSIDDMVVTAAPDLPSPFRLDDLADVNTDGATDGQVLGFDGDSGQWVSVPDLAELQSLIEVLDARITALEQGDVEPPPPPADPLAVANHGATSSMARPDAAAVLWVGEAEPDNALIDLWLKANVATGDGAVVVAGHGDNGSHARPSAPVVLWVGLESPDNSLPQDLWLQLDTAVIGSSLTVVAHDTNPDLPRPNASVVLWVGSEKPNHAAAQDLWVQPTPGVLLDLLNNPRVRVFVDDARLFVRDGAGWAPTPATPPTSEPGPDVDTFSDRNAPLRFSFTRDLHLPWLTDDGPNPTVEWITRNGQAGLDGNPSGHRVARFDTGLDETTTHHVKVVLGDEPAEGFEVGVAAAATTDSYIRLLHSDFFADVWQLQAVTDGPDDNLATLGGLEAAPGDVLIVEVGTDPGSGASYVFAVLPDGRRMGPFPLPVGYEGRTEQGMVVLGGQPVTSIEVVPESVAADAPLASTEFTGAAGSITGHLTDQFQAMSRSGSVLERDGNGRLHLATSLGVSVANHASVDVRRRDVDITAVCATTVGPSSVGPVACISEDGTEFLRGALFANGNLSLVKRVGGTNTTLAEGSGFDAGDDTMRPVRMVVRWPTVELYHGTSVVPDLVHDLTPTEQSELGGGTRTRVGVGLTKTLNNPSPLVDSLVIRAAGDSDSDLSEYVEVSEVGSDFYSENTYASNRTGPHVASDETHQVVINPKVVGGNVRWFASVREFADPDNWTHYEIPEFGNAPLDDNHNSCAVAIDGSGRIHISGNMHNNTPLLYVFSDPDHDLSQRTVVTQADIGGAWVEEPMRFTYPQLLRRDDGNIIYSCRNAVSTKNSVQLFALWDHQTETWSRPFGADGKLVSGWELTTKYGVYTGRIELDSADNLHVNWTWAEQVPATEGDFGKDARFSDLSHLYITPDGTVRRADRTAVGTIPIRRFTAGLVAFDNNDQSIGMDHTNTCAITASGEVHLLVPTSSVVPFFRHLWHPGTNGGSWTEIGLGEITKARQLHIIAYGDRVFGYGRPKGQNEVALWNLTPGTPTYGGKVAVLIRTELTNGYDPNHDARRLRKDGVLAVQVCPASNGQTISGEYSSVPVQLVEFDLAAAIAAGRV